MVTVETLRQYVPNLHRMTASNIMDSLIEGSFPLDVKQVLLSRYNELSGRARLLEDEEQALVQRFMMESHRNEQLGASVGSLGGPISSGAGSLNRDRIHNREFIESGPSLDSTIEALQEAVETPKRAVRDSEKLPENSETLNIKENTSRFSDAVWYEKIKTRDVLLAGVGGIGSYIVFLLARLNVNSITLYDDDEIESVNLSGQFYNSTQIGQKKVNAISDTVKTYSMYHKVRAYAEKFVPGKAPKDVMICGFDNMRARKDYYAAWKDHVMSKPEEERASCLYIDGRLAAEELQVFCITGEDEYYMKKFEEDWLFDDSQAQETLCSYKQTTFMANMIGSMMTNLFVNHAANECGGFRQLPFMTSYGADTMFLKIEK